MISTKKLIKIARKSHEMAMIRSKSSVTTGICSDHTTNSRTKVEKGHFVVYTLDGHRFVLPLIDLKNYIFRELLAMSEEEFGLPSSGPITFPCDASFMNDAISLIKQRAESSKERALLLSLVTKCSYTSNYVAPERITQPLVAPAC